MAEFEKKKRCMVLYFEFLIQFKQFVFNKLFFMRQICLPANSERTESKISSVNLVLVNLQCCFSASNRE